LSAVGHKIPVDPLEFIKICVRSGKVKWTYHVNMRLKQRFIPRTHILESTVQYEIIEAYPEDKYLPSYLVYSRHAGRIFHILFATDVVGDHVRIVTAYYPTPQEWNKELKSRR
jgi:hypothetical protein